MDIETYRYKDDDSSYPYNNWRCPLSALRARLREATDSLEVDRDCYEYHKQTLRGLHGALSARGRVVARLQRILAQRQAGSRKRSGEPDA